MKKILLVLFVSIITATSTSFAQINKGQWLIGGNGSFSSTKSKLFRTSNLQVSGDAGYFLLNGLAGGVRFTYGSYTSKVELSKYISNSLQRAPFVRYYFLPGSLKINFFADASYFWASTHSKQEDFNINESSSTNGHTLITGLACFIIPSASVELTAGYTRYHNGDKRFQMGAGFKIHIGKK